MRRLKRFAAMPRKERHLLLRSFIWISAVRVGLWVLPLRAIRSIILSYGKDSRNDSVEEVVRAVRTSSRYVPGATCLTQALAAQALLAGSNHQSRIEIGVAKDGELFAAHAWLVCDEQIVLGGPDVTRYVPLVSWEAKEKVLSHSRIV